MRISARTNICMIIGDPVEHSLSPAMHNAAYEALGIDDLFVFVGAHIQADDVKKVVEAVRIMNIRGLTVTIPHKVRVMEYLDVVDPIAQKIGAVNTVVNDHGKLIGYNTDWIGVVTPIEQHTSLAGKSVAMVGAGGAARAIAYGVVEKGALLTIYNRSVEKAEALAKEVNADARPLTALEDVSKTDIIINSTSLGMGDQESETPVSQELIHKDHIVFDAVYIPYETRLLREAKEQGAKVIHGLDMLLYQGMEQFELYTQHKAPEEVMRNVLLEQAKTH